MWCHGESRALGVPGKTALTPKLMWLIFQQGTQINKWIKLFPKVTSATEKRVALE